MTVFIEICSLGFIIHFSINFVCVCVHKRMNVQVCVLVFVTFVSLVTTQAPFLMLKFYFRDEQLCILTRWNCHIIVLIFMY